jgi:hypothetical protein
MGALLFLLFLIILAVATALGFTADSRQPGRWYPALPDEEL